MPADLHRLQVSLADERASYVHRDFPDARPRLACERMGRRRALALCRELNQRLRHGNYRPSRAYLTDTPKTRGGVRTIAVLTVEDRIVYEALVRPVRPRVEATLCPRDVLFGPRGTTSALRWWSFERAPLGHASGLVLRADVANAWASIAHDVVATTLAEARCPATTAEAIVEFLGTVMSASRGLPTGLAATECLATAVLGTVDRDLCTRGWLYARCSDDIRIAVASPAQARAATCDLVGSLGRVRLTLRPEGPELVEQCQHCRASKADVAGWVWERASVCRDGRLIRHPAAMLARTCWRRVHAGPRARRAAAKAVDVATQTPIDRTEAEPVLKWALDVLTSAKDPAILGQLVAIIEVCPGLTSVVARYLDALLRTAAARSAHVAAAGILRSHLLEVQQAWLYRSLLSGCAEIDDEVLERAYAAVTEPSSSWMSLTEAARLLAARDQAWRRETRRLAADAPPPFARELTAIAAGATIPRTT